MRTIENPDNFMQAYVYEGDMAEVEDDFDDGTTYLVPVADLDHDEEAIRYLRGVFYGRLSANGYLDCTPWIVGTSMDGVLDDLEALYGDD